MEKGCNSCKIPFFGGKWKDRSYVPKAGDIIFFNWNGDQKIDHVGIVVNTSKGKVNTI